MMKMTTLLNNIDKMLDKVEYKNIYIEISNDDDKYTFEKEKKKPIGFNINKK